MSLATPPPAVVTDPAADDGVQPAAAEHAHESALLAIERERFHSYSHLVRNLHWLAATLVLLFAALEPAGHRLQLAALSGAMVTYTLLLHAPPLVRFGGPWRMAVETALDLGWVTAVVMLSGGSHSPFFFLYYAVLFAASPDSGRWRIYLKATAATALAIGVLAVAPGGTLVERFGRATQADLLWPLAGLWLVAYFAAESSNLGAGLHRSLFLAAHTDELTGLPNLRSFTAVADLRGRLGQPYAIVMVDADYLKQTNDTYGHALGSELIKRVGEALRRAARSGDDLCSRLGGDEFIVRLAHANLEGANAYSQRVRQFLAEHPLHRDDGGTLPVSVSMGLAAFPDHGKSLSEVTERADQALYQSKRQGRGRTTAWSPT